MNDDELRAGLRTLAEPAGRSQVPEVGVIQRRARRLARRSAAVSAAMVAVLAVVAAVAVPRLMRSPGQVTPVTRGPGHTGWVPPGPLPGPDAGPASAPYFLLLAGASPLEVTVSRTNLKDELAPALRMFAVVSPPGRGTTFTGITAAADDRTFLLTGTTSAAGRTAASYFELRLRPDGTPYPLTRLAISPPLPPDGSRADIALSPDGSTLAIDARTGTTATVEVVDLATGTVHAWSAPGSADSLSWITQRKLALLWRPAGRSGLTIRVLDTSSTGSGLLVASRLLVPASAQVGRFHRLAAGQITATAGRVFALMSRPVSPTSGPGHQTGIAAFSAATGAPLGMVNQYPQQAGVGFYCGVLWADRSGLRLISSCGGSAGLTVGSTFTELGPRGHSLWGIYNGISIAW
ncbi:MAG: hypothetical protein ACYCO9_14960 [Streptosporangiaceae bacterium]